MYDMYVQVFTPSLVVKLLKNTVSFKLHDECLIETIIQVKGKDGFLIVGLSSSF